MRTSCFILLLIFITVFVSCNNDDDGAYPSGLLYAYTPGNVGHEIIYDAILITKDEFSGEHDTDIFQVKEVIDSVFLDNQGRPTQRLERYKRPTANDPWVISDVWTSNLTANNMEKKEDNITYVKLIFPITLGATWNGNSLNTYDPQNYEYTVINQPGTVNGISFDSTLTVLQRDEDYFTEKFYEVEQFAKNVGCIYKEKVYVKKDNSQFPLVGITAQSKYTEKIVSWSN